MKKSSNSVRIGIAVAVILGTIGWLAVTSISANKSYYVTVAELGKMGEGVFGMGGQEGVVGFVRIVVVAGLVLHLAEL